MIGRLPRIMLALLLILGVLAAVACGSEKSSPTFEQKQSAVIIYLKAFDDIDNSLTDVFDNIQFPSSYSNIADLLTYNVALSQSVIALDGAEARMKELHPSPLVPETADHLQLAKNLMLTVREFLVSMQEAISAGDQTGIAQAADMSQIIVKQGRERNEATEQLLLKYNISDAAVNYQQRGW